MEPSQTSITPEWQIWIAENICLDATEDSILTTLTQNGIEPAVATEAIRMAMSHPFVMAGKKMLNKLKKRDWVLQNYCILNSYSPFATTIERRNHISHFDFFENYYTKNRPVIITDAMNHWKAPQLWTLEYLKSKYGDIQVELQGNRESNPFYETDMDAHKMTMLFGDYVDHIANTSTDTNDMYITARNAASNPELMARMAEEIDTFPAYLNNNDPNKSGFLWFGPKGTITPLHHDLTNNFMAQVIGSKRIKMIAPYQLPHIYNNKHCYSLVDAENLDIQRYPLLKNITMLDFTLHTGELLFLPVGWWHHVRGLETSITLTFTNFLAPNDFVSHYSTYGEQ